MSLKQYIDDLNDLPEDVLLGRIVVYTIYDHPVMLPDVQNWFTELTLNPAFIPKPNKMVDAFKKATKELDGKTYPMSGERVGILMCRDVQSTNDYIVRQITREVRNKARARLTYAEAIKCVYTRGGEQFQHPVNRAVLEPEEVQAINGFARRLGERYLYHANYLDNMKLRAMVRNYLKHLNCVEIKPGVYYVNCSKDEELHRLAELVNRLGGGSHMNMIPIVNIKREREFISRMWEREAADQLQSLTKEIDQLLRDRKKITPAMYAKMKGRHADVMDRAAEHDMNLDINQAITLANEEVARKALTRLEQRLIQDGD